MSRSTGGPIWFYCWDCIAVVCHATKFSHLSIFSSCWTVSLCVPSSCLLKCIKTVGLLTLSKDSYCPICVFFLRNGKVILSVTFIYIIFCPVFVWFLNVENIAIKLTNFYVFFVGSWDIHLFFVVTLYAETRSGIHCSMFNISMLNNFLYCGQCDANLCILQNHYRYC